MKLALLTLTRGTVSGGYAKYLREVVPRLRTRAELRVYVPQPMVDLDPLYVTWPAGGVFATAAWLRREIARWAPDVVFIPSSVHLDFGPIPVVTMMRNMEPLDHPFAGNTWTDRMRNVARALLARRACKRSMRIIAVSGHVRQALVSRWGIDPERIAVVPHGVDQTPNERAPRALSGGLPFVFTAGSIRPARGLEDLLGAVDAIPANHRIAIAGEIEHEAYSASLRAMHEGDDRVVWLGRLSPEEMGWCFRNARVFVMTSRAEACPNTVLEAMAYGCLSVSTDQPPMPEFYADAALYYRRGDPRDLARTLARAFELDANQADAFRSRALERAGSYTWDATVDATLAQLQRAMSYNARRSRGIRA